MYKIKSFPVMSLLLCITFFSFLLVFSPRVWTSDYYEQEYIPQYNRGIYRSISSWQQVDGVVLLFPMNEGSGSSLIDTGGDDHHGTIYGASWTEGRAGGGLYFHGTDYATYSFSGNRPANNFTLEAWVKAREPHQIDWEKTSGTSGTGGQKYVFFPTYMGSNGGIGLSVGTNGISVYEHGSGYLPALAVYQGDIGTGWNHIIVTLKNKQPRIYLNGILVKTGLTSPRLNSYAPSRLGYDACGGFHGDLDGVAIYNRVLSAVEIRERSLNPEVFPKYYDDGARILFDMGEGTGPACYDMSGENNNGALHGPAHVEGKTGGGLSFDGIDDYCVYTYHGGTPCNNFTLEAWVKTSATHQIDTQSTGGTGGTKNQKYLFWPDHQGINGGIGVSVGTNGISVYEHGDGYMPALAVYAGNLGTGWNHIIVTIQNKQPSIYLNGIRVKTGLTSPRSSSFAPTRIAQGPYGAFQGQVDMVKVYDRVLPGSEIAEHYSNQVFSDMLTHDNGTYEYSLTTAGDFTRLSITDYEAISSPGDPRLPYKDLFSILPPDADEDHILLELTGAQYSQQSISLDIEPGEPVLTEIDGQQVEEWGRDKRIVHDKNSMVYGVNSLFPLKSLHLVNVGRLRKWKIARVRYFPSRYNPVTRTLVQSGGGSVSLSYNRETLPPGMDMASAYSLSDTLLDPHVRDMSVNYHQAKSWYSDPTLDMGSLPLYDYESLYDTGNEDAGFLILTTEEILSQSEQIGNFITHKINMGFRVMVETESAWDHKTGDQATEAIREYLIAHYIPDEIKYVLFIGNPHPDNGDVPMKVFNPDPGTHPPSDMYYADLTSEWDYDGDGEYGEYTDDYLHHSMDRYPEVLVGRIPFYPVDDIEVLDSILHKIMQYEDGCYHGEWMEDVILSMPSANDLGTYQFGEAIRSQVLVPGNYNPIRIYTETNVNPPPEFSPCTIETVLNVWKNHAGFHFWFGHGGPTATPGVFASFLCDELDDEYPSFVYQASCSNGSPSLSNNLGYSLLKNGAIATVSATSVAYAQGVGDYYNYNKCSIEGIGIYYGKRIMLDGNSFGYALLGAKSELPVDNFWWRNYCCMNLYGDPSVDTQFPYKGIWVSPEGDDIMGSGTYLKPVRTIQKGIDRAHPYAMVHVLPGDYEENIIIGKPVFLKSMGPNSAELVHLRAAS